MKSRKLFALLMAAMMAASLASCNSSEEASEPAEDSSSASTSESSTSAESSTPASTKTDSGVLAATTDVTAEDILARDYSEPVTISFAGIQCTDGLDYNHGNEYYEWWSETFNVTWDITSLTFDNCIEAITPT